jgi:hypothetical protein
MKCLPSSSFQPEKEMPLENGSTSHVLASPASSSRCLRQIIDDVRYRIARTPRGCDRLCEIAICKDAAAPAPISALAQLCIDMPGGRDLEALEAARERLLALGLDQKVDVIALQADVHDPDAFAQRRHDRRLAERLVHVAPAQASDGRNNTQHDVERMPQLDLGPLAVWRARSVALRLAACTPAFAAVLEQLLLNVSLAIPSRSGHRDIKSIAMSIAICKLIEQF